ncbi:lipoyl synthase [Ectothiorhodospiraceae bacterium 2226]|nr:lipoyl synthase [Ectothiorhodospiraceae bacterium 2226]
MAYTPAKFIPVFDHSAQPNVARMPAWIRQSLGDHAHYGVTERAVRDGALHTVCEEARCPNRGECWSRGTATFMLLGDTCTRACGFCAVRTGRPAAADQAEPERVAEAVARMGLDYVVLTSVNRDDLPDGGAGIFAATLRALQTRRPDIGLEVLTPDFRACQDAAVAALDAAVAPGAPRVRLVWGHNVETVPSLYRTVRKGSDYRRSLALLERAARLPGVEAKSALMLGLGEREDEVHAVLADLRAAGVARLALGQYLRPTRFHLPVREYIAPDQFARYAEHARDLGFRWVKAGPLVRSSYHAESA